MNNYFDLEEFALAEGYKVSSSKDTAEKYKEMYLKQRRRGMGMSDSERYARLAFVKKQGIFDTIVAITGVEL